MSFPEHDDRGSVGHSVSRSLRSGPRPFRQFWAALATAAVLQSQGLSIARAADADTTGSATNSTAASASAPAGALEQIIVTATKYSENVQNVPMSITPISAATLEQAAVVDFQDYAHMVPNLSFSHSYGAQGADVAIRGIQGQGTTAFYIDDLPVEQALDPKLLNNVQRIEVLRGPQGTLFGARSMGGTVRVITETPNTNKWSGAINVEGSDYNGGRPGYQVDGYLNIPLVADKLALRISAFDGSAGPFIRRYWLVDSSPAALAGLANSSLAPSQLRQYPLSSELTARNNYGGGMASLQWKATDDLTITGMFMRQVSNFNGWPLADFEVTPATSDYRAESMSHYQTFDIPEYDNLNWWIAGLTVKYQTPLGELTSATGYIHENNESIEDVSEWTHSVFMGLSPIPAPILTWNRPHTFVEELRFASRPIGPVEFVGGVYVYRQSASFGQYWNVPGINAATGGQLGQDLGVYYSGLNQDYENAVYGDLTYHITSKLSALAGLRQSHVFTSNNAPDQQGFFAVPPGVKTGGSNVQNIQTPKASLQYQQTPNLMFYALASKGFRPGNGQGVPPPDACAADYSARGLTPNDLATYNADSLWNYEIGAKTESADHRLQLNVSAYQINWTNLQQLSRFTSCGYVFNVNAGAARSRGGEIAVAVAPLAGLQLAASAGYQDAVITESSPSLSEQVGSPVQQIAPWNASASADYSFPLDATRNGLLRVDYNYTDHSYSANSSNFRLRPAYELVNVRAGVQSDQWRIEAFINNVTDAHPNLGDSASEAGEDPGRPRIYTMAPRTFGMRAGYKF